MLLKPCYTEHVISYLRIMFMVSDYTVRSTQTTAWRTRLSLMQGLETINVHNLVMSKIILSPYGQHANLSSIVGLLVED